MAEPHVSIRSAASTVGVPLSSFRRVLQAEPSLRCCVRPAGPRRPAQVDLPRLVAAWQRLSQAPSPAAADLSPRQQHTRDRCIRLWWQGCSLALQAAEESERWVEVAITRQAEADFHRELHQALDQWADQLAPQLPGLPPGDAIALMELAVRELLVALSSRGDALERQEEEEPAATLQLAPPDPLPPEDELRATIERHRGRLHELTARAAAGELVPAEAFHRRAFDIAHGIRDQLLVLPAKIAPLAKSWRNESQVRTQLGRAISEVLPPP